MDLEATFNDIVTRFSIEPEVKTYFDATNSSSFPIELKLDCLSALFGLVAFADKIELLPCSEEEKEFCQKVTEKLKIKFGLKFRLEIESAITKIRQVRQDSIYV